MTRCRIDILPSAYIAGAVLLLTFPLRWIIAWVTAAAIHELGHIIAVLSLKGRIKAIKIGVFGANIEILPMPPLRELICALAGPVSGLLLLLFFRRIPVIAPFALVQSLVNLLPLYPLDGGRALRCALAILAGEYRAERILKYLEFLLLMILTIIGFLSFFLWDLGLLPLSAALLLTARSRMRKIPCKSGSLGLQ